jgi:prepilin signal peptidase PulO-like enzyme (type II secretory pathway)
MNIWLMVILASVIGACLGSFLNVLVFRWKHDISLVNRRSFCIECEEKVPWYHNIPIISFLILGGKCSKCNAKISWQYLLVELWLAVVFGGVVWLESYLGFSWELIRDGILLFVMTFIFVYDLKYQLIPDRVTIPAIILFLAGYIFFGWNSPEDILVGILVGGGFFLAQFLISQGRWIGGGDIRLGVLMGIILGWPQIILGLFLAYVSGAIVSIFLILFKDKKFASKTPFGTYLVFGTLVAHFFSQEIVNWYFSLVLF